jgi:hypothetical protein
VATIKDLQSQAALLLRHPKRTPNFIVLVLDQTKLPTLKYRDDMSQDQKEQALLCLQSATTASRIGIFWDEDDSQALDVLRKTHGYDGDEDHTFCIHVTCPPNAPELEVLAYLPHVQASVRCNVRVGELVDLGFLSRTSLETLEVVDASIASWDFATNLGLKGLILIGCTVRTSMATLSNMDFLNLDSTIISPQALQDCVNLKTLFLDRHYTLEQVSEFRYTLPNVEVVQLDL